jgi:hypothetical protein
MLDLSIFKKMFTFFKRSFGFFLYIIIFIVIITVFTSLNATTPGKQTSYGTIAITASDSLRKTKDFKDLVHYLKKYYTIAENITDINYALETAYIDGHITVPDNFLEGDNKIDVKTGVMSYSLPISANLNQFIHAKKTGDISLLYKRLNVSYISNDTKKATIKQFYIMFLFLAFRIYSIICSKLYKTFA